MDSDVISNIIKFNAQTNGRDKMCRLFQYGCKLAWGHLQSKHKNEWLPTLKNIESVLSMTRKLLRFGKSLDFIQGALKSINLPDSFLRLTITLSKINQAFYLLFDHFLWFHNVGAVKLDKKYWSDLSSRFYLATLILNLARDVYGIFCIIEEEIKAYKLHSGGSAYMNDDSNHRTVTRRQSTVLEVFQQNFPLILDVIKNFFDLTIPMCSLDMLTLSPQMQGISGIISTLAAAITVWNPKLKLVPS